jgi:hypothetical protein
VQITDFEGRISARRNPACRPTDRIARSRRPAIVSSPGKSSSFLAPEGGCGTFVAIDRRAFHLPNRIAWRVPVPNQVLIER